MIALRAGVGKSRNEVRKFAPEMGNYADIPIKHS